MPLPELLPELPLLVLDVPEPLDEVLPEVLPPLLVPEPLPPLVLVPELLVPLLLPEELPPGGAMLVASPPQCTRVAATSAKIAIQADSFAPVAFRPGSPRAVSCATIPLL